jgi:hypothetical protein
MRNLLTRVPKSAQGLVATLVRTIFAQPDDASTLAQHTRIVEQLESRFPAAAELLADAAGDLLAFTAFPKRALAPDLVQQPPRATQPRAAAPHRRGRDLPQPGSGHPPGRGGAG